MDARTVEHGQRIGKPSHASFHVYLVCACVRACVRACACACGRVRAGACVRARARARTRAHDADLADAHYEVGDQRVVVPELLASFLHASVRTHARTHRRAHPRAVCVRCACGARAVRGAARCAALRFVAPRRV